MKRKIIEIDQNKCNGCGQCIPNCPEGALQVIDGKARLVSDLFCDGLGACVGTCPLGAITTVEREAEPYDEEKVMANIVPQGKNTIAAHLQHLKSHGEIKLYEIAVNYLKKQNMDIPQPPAAAGGCPGSLLKRFLAKKSGAPAVGASALRQWPIQLKLLNPGAEYFDNAHLLISADCAAHAYGEFHGKLLDGKILIIFCPKLDSDINGYVEKLARIFTEHPIAGITIARMEVPCCGGTAAIVEKALEAAQKKIPVEIKVIGIDGSLSED